MGEQELHRYLYELLSTVNGRQTYRSVLTREQISEYTNHGIDIQNHILRQQVSYLSEYILKNNMHGHQWMSAETGSVFI